MENPGPSSISENSSQKIVIRTDKINEIVNDSDSDDGSFSELSNSETYEPNSPFSSSSSKEAEEEILQPKPDSGRKERTRRAIPKRANTDLELGWIEKIRKIQKPAFSGVPGINKNCQITQDSSPLDIFEIFFSTDLFFCENVAEGLLASAGTEPQVQGQTSSPTGRLIGRDHFLYRIPVTHAKLKGKSQRSCRVRAERSKGQTGKTKKMHDNVLSKM
jgi:hypothetical protein